MPKPRHGSGSILRGGIEGLLAAITALLAGVVAALVVLPVAVVLLLAEGVGGILGRRQVVAGGGGAVGCRAASIIVVSWNGRHHLEKLLPSLFADVEADGGDHEVIVVDNGSTDGTVTWLEAEWPRVRAVALAENRYFVRGNAAGVEVASRDVLVFLNNDMVVGPGFLGALLRRFTEPDVFAVTAQVELADPDKPREETGLTRAWRRRGQLVLQHELPILDELDPDSVVPALWAGGGSAAFDRAKYLELGGFDMLFDPFYGEDLALSYAAWKRGWRVLFAPEARVVHEHRGTSRKAFGDTYVDRITRRNVLLCQWGYVTDGAATAAHFAWLPLTVAARARRRGPIGGPAFELTALLGALRRLPGALARRHRERRAAVRSDREVLERSARVEPGTRDGVEDLLVLAGRLPRRDRDGSWVTFLLLRELARRHRVTLAGIVEPGGEPDAVAALEAEGVRVVPAVRRRWLTGGNLHHQVPPRLARHYGAPGLRREIGRILRAVRFDVVQVEYVEMAFVAAPFLRGRHALYTCHESLAVAGRRACRQARGPGRLRAEFARLRDTVWEVRALRVFRRVLALSSVDADTLRPRLAPIPVTANPSPVELPPAGTASAPSTARPPRIAFVGYYRHAPNLDAAHWLAGEILPRVRRHRPDVELDLIGGEPPESLRALDDGTIHVHGFVPDLAAALRRAAVVAVPLREGGGLRGKVLEAWAHARPVVATPVAVAGLAATPGEQFLLAEDAGAFAAALVRCLEEEGLAETLGASARAYVARHHSTASFVAAYEDAYRELVRPEAAP